MQGGNAKWEDLLIARRCLDSKSDVGGLCLSVRKHVCFGMLCFKHTLPPGGGERVVLLRHNVHVFFVFFFMSKRQSTTNNVAAESESVAWAQLESKGPSLVAKGQFQGPEIPIGSLLCLIGWEILINEIYLDFSWWIHSAANLNPSTCYCLESYRLRLVWPPERSASNNFSLGTHQKANDVLKTPEKSHRTMMQFLLKTEHTFWCTNREQLSREFSFFCRVSVREKKEKKNTCFVPLWQVKI